MATNKMKEVPYAEFGERLMKLRAAAGMTRQQLGDICGVAPSTIVNYERGLRIPYADTAVKMAQAFSMTTEELIGVENPDIEMAKAEAIDSMRATNGSVGAARLERALSTVNSVLAGGELSEEQAQKYISEMQKIAFVAQQRLREMHTNKRYKGTVEKRAVETKEAIDTLNDKIRSLSTQDGE